MEPMTSDRMLRPESIATQDFELKEPSFGDRMLSPNFLDNSDDNSVGRIPSDSQFDRRLNNQIPLQLNETAPLNRGVPLPQFAPKSRRRQTRTSPLGFSDQFDTTDLYGAPRRLNGTNRNAMPPTRSFDLRPNPEIGSTFDRSNEQVTAPLPRSHIRPRVMPRGRATQDSRLLLSRPKLTALAQTATSAANDESRPNVRLNPAVDPTGRPSALRRELMYRALLGEFGI